MSSIVEACRPYDFSAVTGQVEQWGAHGYYAGAGLIIGRRQQIVHEEYFGLYGPQTEVFIASAGKWLAAATIAAMVDRNELSWDDTVAQWLPMFGDDAGEVRLRQLLSHTSGFAEQQPPGLRNDDYQTLEESVTHIAELPLKDRPGARFRYGGLAMQVAGRMAELAAGQSFEELFQRYIARPLGLAHTRFTPVDATPGHSPMLAGGARSSTPDYARFVAMIAGGGAFDGKQVLSRAAIEEMQRDQVGQAKVEPGEFVERAHGARHTAVYGLGQWRERIDPEGRATRLSSPSWAGTYPWVDAERETYGVLLAHVDLDGPSWNAGFDPFYASSSVAELVAAAIDRAGD